MGPVNVDNVEMVFGDGNGAPSRTASKMTRNSTATTKPSYQSNHGNAPYVDFENVFDPFERDADDLHEFFGEETTGPVDLDDEVNPNQIFHNPMNVSCCDYDRVHTRMTAFMESEDACQEAHRLVLTFVFRVRRCSISNRMVS